MKPILIALAFFISLNIFGQINIGPIEHVKMNPGEFDQADLGLLRNSTTLFVYRDSDEDILDELQSALNEAWDYTELEFISYEEFSTNTYDDNYSFFTISGLHKEIDNGDYTYIYLNLWMYNKKEKLSFSRIELFPTFPTLEMASKYAFKNVNLLMKYFYEESILHNWNLVYLRNALQFTNDKLEKSEVHWLFHSEVFSDLSHLKTDTLYVPEYILIKFNSLLGGETKMHGVDELFKKYPYPYKVLSISELSEKITNSTKHTFYLSYIKSSTYKFIAVFNANTGELLYSENYARSYNIKTKDLAKLSKAID